MEVVAGPFVVTAALLAVGGVAKLARPEQTVGALRKTGLPASAELVRVGASAELVIALGAVVSGSRVLAGLVAVSYVAFAAFVVRALRRHVPIGSCGCFGRAETPPSVIHVALDAAFAGVAAVVALERVDVPAVIARQPWAGVPFLALCGLCVYLTFLSLTSLPRVLSVLPAETQPR